MDALKQFLHAIRESAKNIHSLSLLCLLYALLLASLYIFVSTREATVVQVLITFTFLVLIPAEFFVLQSGILTISNSAKWQWPVILINAVKLFVVTIPILIIGYLIWILLTKWQLRYPAPHPPIVFPPAAAKPLPLHWPSLLFATIRGLLFAVVIPLATIHLWIEIAGRNLRTLFSGGAGATLKRFGQIMSQAFTSSAVFIYALGLILFGLIPYGLLIIHPSPKGTKTDFALFIVRLLLVFAFTLFGWVVTLSALFKSSTVSPAQIGATAEATA